MELAVSAGQQVVKGFDVAVKSMSEGMIAEVTIPAYYGEAGCPPGIPRAPRVHLTVLRIVRR
jgi:FKBP-type peptidyl-prolyl cis-trans isomerase